QHILSQGINQAIDGEFPTAIISLCAFRQDLDEQRGITLDVIRGGGPVALIAGHQEIGVEEAVRGGDPELHVGGEEPTGGAAQVGVKAGHEIDGHRRVRVGDPGHCEHLAPHVFVFVGLLQFPGEIVFRTEAIVLLGLRDHG
ncbi:hypothetical protein RZS08_20885, partial [Arthrospira platensis SPKY1]|nr:hypothetical protein [Arthrospira platensis SPKY1]